MNVKSRFKSLSLFALSLVLILFSVGFGSGKAEASEWGMLSANYVTENSISIHFEKAGYGEVTLYKDGEAIYTYKPSVLKPDLIFDYVVTSLQSNTSYNFEIRGTTAGGEGIYDQDVYTTKIIPEETETLGPVLTDSTTPDSVVDNTPLQDDVVTSTSPYTTDGYYYLVKRTTGWDKVGDNYRSLYDPQHIWSNGLNSAIIYSTGGSFQITIKGITGVDKVSSRAMTVTLKEWDGYGKEQKIKTWNIQAQTYDQNLTINNVNSYLDGTNKNAEFKIYCSWSSSLDSLQGKQMIFFYFD